MAILLAVGDCFSAFLLGPVLQELRARGIAFRVAAGGEENEVPGLRQLLGSEATVRPIAKAEAVSFAMEVLEPAPTCVVTVGSCHCNRKIAAVAAHRGVRTVHLDGGIRAFGVRVPTEPAAGAYCVAGEAERFALIQDGRDPASITVIGDLVATAVAAISLGAVEPSHGLGIVFERAGSSLGASELVAFAKFAAIWAPPEWPLRPAPARDAAPAAWLTYVATSQVLVTDSVGWQRVAVALGVPCVAVPGCGLWAPGVAAGLVTEPDGANETIAAAVRRLAAQPRGTPARPTGVARRIVDAMLAAGPSPAVALPSDGDASGRTFTNDEAALVSLVLQRGTLNSTRGTMVRTFEQRFAQWLGRKHAIACASGSAAVHCAIAALRLQPGDEVITTPITDMGALTPILYEGAVPVFADVEPVTLNVTAASVRAQLTARTRAIVVTHLFGNPCDLDGLAALAQERDLALIEDAAQAFGATLHGRKVGTFGALGTFSLQQGKHITTGEGGIVATDDDDLARRVFLYVNKAWGYGDSKPDHYFPALNYRLTELQGAVAIAQLPKLDWVIARRREVAAALRRELANVPGLHLPDDPPSGTHSFWKFAFFVDPAVVEGGAAALGKRMQAAGVACVPNYIQKPAFECALFRDWRNSPVTWLPLQHNPRGKKDQPFPVRADYPGAVQALERVVVLPINEQYRPEHVAAVAAVIRAATAELQHA